MKSGAQNQEVVFILQKTLLNLRFQSFSLDILVSCTATGREKTRALIGYVTLHLYTSAIHLFILALCLQPLANGESYAVTRESHWCPL